MVTTSSAATDSQIHVKQASRVGDEHTKPLSFMTRTLDLTAEIWDCWRGVVELRRHG